MVIIRERLKEAAVNFKSIANVAVQNAMGRLSKDIRSQGELPNDRDNILLFCNILTEVSESLKFRSALQRQVSSSNSKVITVMNEMRRVIDNLVIRTVRAVDSL